jgi:hypothetical protein
MPAVADRARTKVLLQRSGDRSVRTAAFREKQPREAPSSTTVKLPLSDNLSHDLSRDVVTAAVEEGSQRCGPLASS